MNSIKQELTEIYVEVADFFKSNPEPACRQTGLHEGVVLIMRNPR